MEARTQEGLGSRFKVWELQGQPYVFNKIIFRSIIVLMILFVVAAWLSSGSLNPLKNNLYLECKPGLGPCANPVYKYGQETEQYTKGLDIPEWLINTETLPPGFVYGSKNFFIEFFGFFVFLLVLGGLLLNHLLYNKGFKFEKVDI